MSKSALIRAIHKFFPHTRPYKRGEDPSWKHGPDAVMSPENIKLWENTPGTYLYKKKRGLA